MRKLQLGIYGTLAILCFIGSCIGGCAMINYTAPTGDQLSYSRLGLQKISGLKIIKDKDGIVRFEFDSQEGSEGQAIASLAKTIENLSSLVK